MSQEQANYHTRTDCRFCSSKNLKKIWSFGPTPLANSYLLPEQIGLEEEVTVPLDVYYCQDCHLVQLRDVVAPNLLFKNYLYVSSTSPSFVRHFQDYAQHVTERFHLTNQDLVVDIGSNDGVLLKPFQVKGIKVLGVDPAENVSELAREAGIPTETAYFTPAIAKNISAKYGRAKIITANNVFAHTDGVDSFVAAVKEMLTPDGVFIFEVQYLADLIDKNLFDIVYHEHVNYYHVAPLTKYFASCGMQVFDVERVPVHGGSIRVYAQLNGAGRRMTAQLEKILEQEQKKGLNSLGPYQAFAQRIATNKKRLRSIINDIKEEGKTIAGFGAPAKATTLMYAFGLTAQDLDFIVDDAPLKQGRVMPGTHVPIYPADALYGDQPHYAPAGATRGRPDYCIILAWNFAASIMQNHQRFASAGGRWIVPVPEPHIVREK